MAPTAPLKWLTANEVCARFRWKSRTTLWSRVAAGDLPAPHHCGRRALWRADEIEAAEALLIKPPRAA